MKDNIDFIYEVEIKELKKYEKLFYKLLKYVKKYTNLNNKLSLSVNYISDEKSIYLNNKYRNKNYVGDVLSFPINDEYNIYSQMNFKEIGDIFIAPNEAAKKANKFNHSPKTEYSWLFVHGLLHILGFDHETKEESEEMFSLTDKILSKIKVKYIYL
ncbi:16S rRNA maturation RNase YbeY [Spiroplasma litorale]|uniref:Endoribonuclease YbeY n=1 Tax=Spiroplasma litorale TaxID=216942 RepID=A0A0K1W0T7_9MOLU|nr:rRNA maturation RNase YbeY [Spiroplasma litorale]AKX33940.1 16S rRNA maturation RNase YbeY [Spiroplasma litorale]